MEITVVKASKKKHLLMEKINYVICLKWQKIGKNTIVPNEAIKQGTFDELANEIKTLSQRVIYKKKSLPILFTTSRKVSQTENYTFQTEEKFKGDHELLCLDYESNELSRRQAENRIKKLDLRYIAYNTFSHGVCAEKKYRYRIIVQLNRAYKPEDFKLVKKELQEQFSFGKDGLDMNSFKQNSFMFLAAIFEGNRKPKITEHKGGVLNLESMLLRVEAERAKPKPLSKNITVPDENELNEELQDKELKAVHQLLNFREKGNTHDFLRKGVIRLKYAGFDDATIINELEGYETPEHRGRVAKIYLPDNYVQSLEIDPKFYRFKFVTRYGQQWKYDKLKKLYYNEVMDSWVKQPKRSQHLSDDDILIREFEIASFEFLKDHFKNEKLVELTMVLLHFVVMTNREIDGFIKKLLPQVQEKFYFKDDNGKRLRKGVYFNCKLLQKFKETTKLAELDIFNLPGFKSKIEIEGRVLDWLTGLNELLFYHKLIVLYKEKIEGVNPISKFEYYNWATYLLPLPKLKNSNSKKYKLRYKPAVNLYKAMKEELVFKIADVQDDEAESNKK